MNHKKTKTSISYEDAGVSVTRSNQLIESIKQTAAITHDQAVMSDLGGFGALYDFASLGYQEPVLVSSTDGVGTKIKLAIESNRHTTIGIDLVAMCVNDLLVQGARPLFFLDYFACSKLDVDTASQVINGIARGCKLSACSLIGGETAEMPGMYAPHEYDLAGFCVGVVEKSELIDGSAIQAKDKIIALASSGPHSNGYSLIRKLLSDRNIAFNLNLNGKPMLEYLLTPTKIYAKNILQLMTKIRLTGLAHITGGGLLENVPRVLPDNLCAKINSLSWKMPKIFEWLKQQGNIPDKEMYRTFNCGIGMILIVRPDDLDKAINILSSQSISAWHAGEIIARDDDTAIIIQ